MATSERQRRGRVARIWSGFERMNRMNKDGALKYSGLKE